MLFVFYVIDRDHNQCCECFWSTHVISKEKSICYFNAAFGRRGYDLKDFNCVCTHTRLRMKTWEISFNFLVCRVMLQSLCRTHFLVLDDSLFSVNSWRSDAEFYAMRRRQTTWFRDCFSPFQKLFFYVVLVKRCGETDRMASAHPHFYWGGVERSDCMDASTGVTAIS